VFHIQSLMMMMMYHQRLLYDRKLLMVINIVHWHLHMMTNLLLKDSYRQVGVSLNDRIQLLMKHFLMNLYEEYLLRLVQVLKKQKIIKFEFSYSNSYILEQVSHQRLMRYQQRILLWVFVLGPLYVVLWGIEHFQ
jgi:hypothetical protein